MNIKLTALTAGILVGISSAASALPIPTTLTPPTEYNTGPLSPGANVTDMSSSEEAAFALFEGVLQVTEAKIHADQRTGSCGVFSVPVSINTNSSTDGSSSGTISVGGSQGVKLTAFVQPASLQGRGQAVTVSGSGNINGITIPNYNANYVYNAADDLLVSTFSNTLVIENGSVIQYSGSVIKDFLPGDQSDPIDAYNIYDWGLQAVSKLGYPVEKWWQRSISHRNDGTNGRTVFVKDRLVGDSPCRIVLETNGTNDRTVFIEGGGSTPGYNYGRLTVSHDKPGAPVLAVDPLTPSAAPSEVWYQSPFNGN
jgi:hypothetical protein